MFIFNKHHHLTFSGAGKWSTLGSSGASHGGVGGRGGCGGYTTCRLERNMPYGDLYLPNEHGSGGALSNGGTGKYNFRSSNYLDFIYELKKSLK